MPTCRAEVVLTEQMASIAESIAICIVFGTNRFPWFTDESLLQ